MWKKWPATLDGALQNIPNEASLGHRPFSEPNLPQGPDSPGSQKPRQRSRPGSSKLPAIKEAFGSLGNLDFVPSAQAESDMTTEFSGTLYTPKAYWI